MSIQSVSCPGCNAAVNISVGMTNVRCPHCATVWNVNAPEAAQLSEAAKQAKQETSTPEQRQSDSQKIAIIASMIGGTMFLFALMGLALVVLNRDPEPKTVAKVQDTIKPAQPESYREINMPEADRRRLYDDYRTVARTSIERPLAVPQGTKVRKDLENMLQKTFDRELMRFAALHDVTVDDVKEVIKEGDAKGWDPSPRSHAVRDGKRVYPEEMSEGWEINPNRK